MNYKDIDYSKYLSLDNGMGVLLSKEDVEVLKRYGFDFNCYSSFKDLLMDLDSFCNDSYVEDDLEEVIQRINEVYYYNFVNK